MFWEPLNQFRSLVIQGTLTVPKRSLPRNFKVWILNTSLRRWCFNFVRFFYSIFCFFRGFKQHTLSFIWWHLCSYLFKITFHWKNLKTLEKLFQVQNCGFIVIFGEFLLTLSNAFEMHPQFLLRGSASDKAMNVWSKFEVITLTGFGVC